MHWMIQLFLTDSVARTVLILSAVIASGWMLGNIRIRGIGLGVAGVLFSGLLFGHFKIAFNEPVLDFLREFGLILFVYAIGIQVGPGFLASLRREGLTLNLLASAIVFLGVGVTLLIHFLGKIDTAAMVGLFSGATTNTPSLAAAQQALKDIPGLGAETLKIPALAYAMAYPFGIVGIITAMFFIRFFLKIHPQRESEIYEQAQRESMAPVPVNVDIEVKNPNLDGLPIKKIPMLESLNVIVSRVLRNNEVEIAQDETILHVGDIIHVVGSKEKLEELCLVVGAKSQIDLRSIPSPIATRRIVVTQSKVLGKSIKELNFSEMYGVTITRVIRSGLEFTSSSGVRFQFGDTALAVGESAALDKIALELGNSVKRLQQPQIIPIFIGIFFGVILGNFPISIPGLPGTFKLGLAGGPLLAAIFFSHIGRIGPLIWYMPLSANMILREVGIALFLSCVGIRCGDRFVDTLTHGAGLHWMGYAALITLIPLLVVGFFARLFYKLNFLSVCGLLAGSMTDPPALAFANSMSSSEAPSLSYATVYPLVMILRVLSAQALVFFFAR